jgi:hypothetical protein
MARRNAQNPRYQKDKLGKTRKSAASAKPKRATGESGSKSTSKSSSDEKPKSRFFQPLPVPDTPRFKRWRKIWLGLLVAAVVFSLAAWSQRGTQLGTVGLVAAYTCIFSAVYIDVTKIRRMRKEYADELDRKGSKGKKSGSK